jgi:hypothetical protein
MKMNMIIDSVVKNILEAIQQRRDLNPTADNFNFEFGGFGAKLDNENDYSALKDALEGLASQAGIKYEITKNSTLYESYGCKITITDKKKFEEFYSCNALQKDDHGQRFPHHLPAGTTWEKIIIKFIDDRNVVIRAGKFQEPQNFYQMGFADKRSIEKPNIQWQLLLLLAKQPVHGELMWDSENAQIKIQKWKERLSKSLKYYFGLSDDPFYPYHPYGPQKQERSYKIRLQLMPPENMEEGKDADTEIDDLFSNQVYEE